ncbi:hypothetical protein FALCPG4_015947 [Fusarium falciforme]
MSLPTLRPGLLPPLQPPTYPTTPPPTSPASSPHKEGPFRESTQTPQPHHEHILLAQEAAEGRRLRAQAEQIWRDSQEYSCAEDNETTPWLLHTKWPELFRNRPVDIIAASTRQPAQGPNQNNEDYVLGVWRGIPLRSPAAAEARLRLLMRAVDDIFDRAEATLACTSYRSRCWLSSYWQETFCNRPLRILPRRTREKYKSRWKHFTCYLFRAFALEPRQRREIYNVPLRADEIAMMRHILDLVSQLKGEEEEEEEEEEAYGDWSDQGEGSEGEEEDEEEDRAEADGYDESDGEGDNHDNDGAGEEDDEGGKDEQDCAPGQHTFRISRGTRLKLSEALFQLSMMFWTHQCQAGLMASSALIHITAVIGIHPRSLAYRSAYSSTPGFAALVWIGFVVADDDYHLAP